MQIQDWNGLRSVAMHGFNDGVLCLASIHVVERSNQESTIAAINETDGGRAARILIESTLFRLHMFVARAFSRSLHDEDRHLRTAIVFLEQPGRIDEEPSEVRRTLLLDAVALFRKLERDPRWIPIKHMRDKLMAHWAEPNPDIVLPTYFELFSFAQQTARVCEMLAQGSGIVGLSMDSQVKAYRNSADAFWSAFKSDI